MKNGVNVSFGTTVKSWKANGLQMIAIETEQTECWHNSDWCLQTAFCNIDKFSV